MSMQHKLLKKDLANWIKLDKQKYALVVFQPRPSAIVPYCPTTHNIMHTFRSFPNTA
jgi:hypothetical protein